MYNFQHEYGIALIKGESSFQNHDTFNMVLNQHALVMVDGAVPSMQPSQYIEIGTRLGDVQRRWVQLLCDSLQGVRNSPVDCAYQETVKKVITNFGKKLNQVLLEDKTVPYEELAGPGIFLHSKVSIRGEQNLAETQRLFCAYIASLMKMYATETREAYELAAIQCFAHADALGTWLDHTIF
jgi:hypothetical protein